MGWCTFTTEQWGASFQSSVPSSAGTCVWAVPGAWRRCRVMSGAKEVKTSGG